MNILFIGIGNDFRRDDGVGLVAVRGLQARFCSRPEWFFWESSGEGTALMSSWQGFDCVVMIDAVMKRGEPGRIVHLSGSENHFPSDFFKYSSHAFSLAEAVEMARVLGRLPREIHVFGIEGADFGFGEGLSPAIERACKLFVGQFRETQLRCPAMA